MSQCVASCVSQYVSQCVSILCIFDNYVEGVKGPKVWSVPMCASTVRLIAMPLAKIDYLSI